MFIIFFHPSNDIIEESVRGVLQNQYSHSPALRRIVNYFIDNVTDADINKFHIYIASKYLYNKKKMR
ncbi:DUF4765 family protein [Escherichia coli]|uniref:DUF4765 family protein n=1 Tax=Escherichia coli TaxID=562 RepID=UPI003CEC5B35